MLHICIFMLRICIFMLHICIFMLSFLTKHSRARTDSQAVHSKINLAPSALASDLPWWVNTDSESESAQNTQV